MSFRDSASNAWLIRATMIGLGAVVVIFIVGQILAAMFIPLRAIGQSVTCQSNVIKLTRSFRLYEDDYDDHIPPSAGWMDRTFFYLDKEQYLHCPAVAVPKSKEYGYAMNSSVAGKDKAAIDRPEEAAIVFDSTNVTRSAFDPMISLPKPGRHRTKPRKGSPSRPGNFVGYFDGSARILLDGAIPTHR